jgi:uncharacterized protein DUF2752
VVISKLKYSSIVFLAIALILVLSLYFFYSPNEFLFFPKCPFYSITGLYCPGCGSQRAIHEIFHGNLWEGLKHNLLFILLFVVLWYQIIIYVLEISGRKIKKNVLHKPLTTYAILIIIILFWILRNIDMYPFTFLAP